MNSFDKTFDKVRFWGLTLATLTASPLAGQGNQPDVAEMRVQMKQMQAASEEQQLSQQRQLAELQARLDRMEAEQERLASEKGEEASATSQIKGEGDWQPPFPLRLGARENFIDISAIGTFAAGASTEPHLEELQAGAHDPRQRGFNVQSLELVLAGIVDP